MQKSIIVFMKSLFFSILIIFMVFASCTRICKTVNDNSHESRMQQATFESASVERFDSILSDSIGVILLDVRTAEEFATGHIKNAINIDVKRNDFDSIANSELQKDKIIAVYCRSGRRSKIASEKLAKNGFKVIELELGYNDWTKKR